MDEILPDEEFFDFKCPYCGDIVSFPASSAHTLQECAACAESVIVPAAGVAVGGKIPLPINTARLRLRRFHPEDSIKILSVVEHDEAAVLPMITETNVDQFIEEQRTALFTRSKTGVFLAVELVETQELAGFVWVYYADKGHNDAGFSVTIIAPLRRRGLGLEAARAMIDFAFAGLCARRVTVSCPSQNPAARRMLEKAGMRQEGEFIKARFDGAEWVNLSYYALLKEERS